jgi:LytR cell envelope-related transcriptional attenuator
MGPIPFALSIHHFINSVGADAGFASIIGLAILILLYFAQARETSSLRKHAYEATDRIEQLEARVAQVSRAPSPAAQPRAAQSQQARPAAVAGSRHAVTVGATADAPAIAPAAPAGVAAPALTAATRLIPAPAAMVAQAQPVAVASPVADPSAADPAWDQAGAAGAGAPRPATVGGGANGAGVAAPPRPATATAPPRPAPAAAPGMARPIASGTLGGASAGRRPGVAPGDRIPPTRPRLPRVLIVALGLLGVAAVVAALLIVTNNSSSTSSSTTSSASNAAGARRSARTAIVNPASVTVAVLNGTATNGLAHRIASRLQSSGYKQGTDGNAPDQTHTATIVAYLPGFKRDAEAVASTLKLSSGAVQQVDQSTQAVACPGPGACNANVVVTVGTDLANGQ